MSSNPGPSLPIPEVKPHIPGFWSLIVTQFQGAFSDNAFRLLVIFLVVGSELSQGGKEGVLLIGALFSLPFVLFSMMGGYFADRFSKRDVTIGTKVFEVAVMLLALIGLATDSLAIKVVAVFLMSVQSAIFGPSKYGLLPELLPEKRLSWGNGILELGTFSAIISGTIMGGLLAESLQGRQYFSGLILIGLALFGLVTSLGIKKVPPADPEKQLPPQFRGRFNTTTSDHPPRPCVVPGDSRKRLFLVSGGVLQIQYLVLRNRGPGSQRDPEQSPTGCCGDWHRRG